MNRIYIIVLMFVIALLIVGCEANHTNNSSMVKNDTSEPVATIRAVTSGEELTTVKATGADTILIFELDIHDKAIKHVEYWVDEYQDGQFVKTVMKASSTRDHETIRQDKIYFTAQDIPLTKEEIWGLVFRQGDSFGRSEIVMDLGHIAENTMKIVRPIMEINASADEAISLGMIALNRGDSGAGSSDVEHMIQDSDVLYVLRCRLN